MLTDNEKAKLLTEPPFLPEQEKFTQNHCGSVESCLTTIEGLSSLLFGWSQGRADQVVGPEETWGIYIVSNMIHDLAVVGQRLKEA
jgi:hypothetical protein